MKKMKGKVMKNFSRCPPTKGYIAAGGKVVVMKTIRLKIILNTFTPTSLVVDP